MTSGYDNFHELRPRIIVMGVGGAGGNAVNNMIASGLQGVEFVAANTDAQALSMSGADMRFQMGVNLTEGLGAGSNPEIGEGAAEEVLEEMKELLKGAHMVFVACGMGGGTGTGAAPVIARVAQEMGVLTVAVVTKPFHFEGRRRMRVADAGIEQLRKYVDTMIVIPNQNLFRLANEQTTFADSFRLADQVLNSGVACVTDLIMKEGLINLDFADVKTVITEMGAAVMGTGMAHGEGRAKKAAEAAISNPLIDDISLAGAKGLLISISGGQDMTLFEVDEVASRIRSEVDSDANIIVGATFDEQLEGHIRVSLVASGLNHAHPKSMHEEADRRRMENDQERERQQSGLRDRLQELEQSPAMPGGRLTPAGARGAVNRAPIDQAPLAPQPGIRGGHPGDERGMDHKASPRAKSQGKVQIVNKPPRFITDGVDGVADTVMGAGIDSGEGFDGPVRGREYMPGAPEAISKPMRRMPNMDELPVTGQNQLRAYEAPPSSHGIEAQKKKVGFFERLTGRGREKPQEQMPRAEGRLSEAPQRRRTDEGHRGEPQPETRAPQVDARVTPPRPEPMTEMRGQPLPPVDAEYHHRPDPNQGDLFKREAESDEGYLREPSHSHETSLSREHAHKREQAEAPQAPRSRHEQAFRQVAEPNLDKRRHDGSDEVQHQGHSEGFVSGVNPNPYAPPEKQAETPGHQRMAEQQPVKGQPQGGGQKPARAADRYPTFEISKGGPTDNIYGPGDDEDDPIGDIPPFLRKTTHKR